MRGVSTTENDALSMILRTVKTFRGGLPPAIFAPKKIKAGSSPPLNEFLVKNLLAKSGRACLPKREDRPAETNGPAVIPIDEVDARQCV